MDIYGFYTHSCFFSGTLSYVGGWLCFMFLAHTRGWNILMCDSEKSSMEAKQVFFSSYNTRERWVIHLALKWCGVWELIEFCDKSGFRGCKVTTTHFYFQAKILLHRYIFRRKSPFLKIIQLNIFLSLSKKLPSSL